MSRKNHKGRTGLLSLLTAAALSALVAGQASADLAGRVVDIQTQAQSPAEYDRLLEEVVIDFQRQFEGGEDFNGEQVEGLPAEISGVFAENFGGVDIGDARFYVVRYNSPQGALTAYGEGEYVNGALSSSCGLTEGVSVQDAGPLATRAIKRHVHAHKAIAVNPQQVSYFAFIMGPSNRFPGKMDIYRCTGMDNSTP